MCGTHARGCLIDGLPFQLQQSFKTLNNKPFLLQHPNHKQKSYGALSQKLHCRRHILFHRQTRQPKIAPACRTYRLRVRLIWMCKNNIPLKPSPYSCCRTISTPFGRCRPTMRITPCAGGWLKPNSPHISLMPKTCLPVKSGGKTWSSNWWFAVLNVSDDL